MNMVWHHNESVQLILVQFPLSVAQRRNDHLCNFRPAQKQRTVRARVQNRSTATNALPAETSAAGGNTRLLGDCRAIGT